MTPRASVRSRPQRGPRQSPPHGFVDFREAVSASFVPLRVTSERPEAFTGRLRSAVTDDVHFCEVSAGEHLVERTPELIAVADQHFYKLSLQLSGSSILIQDNREAVLQPGDMAIYDTHRPYSLCFDHQFSNLVTMFPQHVIDLPVDMVGQLTAVTMPRGDWLAATVAPFLTQLAQNVSSLSGPCGSRLGQSAVALVTALLANQLDVRPEQVSGHRALAQQVFAYIDQHLGSADLNPAQIAAAHYISTRHLHAIFHEQGVTVSSWIRTRRLERCRRDLLDPLLADRTVATVASRWGLLDAAHFSRIFKAAYLESPSDLRARRSSGASGPDLALHPTSPTRPRQAG